MKLIKNLSARRIALSFGLLYTGLISVALLVPTAGAPTFDIPFLDKYVHFLLHFILIFIWLTYVNFRENGQISTSQFWMVLTGCFLYGIIIEAFQHWFTISRTFDLLDIAANGVGEMGGLLLFGQIRKRIFRIVENE